MIAPLLAAALFVQTAPAPVPFVGEGPRHWQSGFLIWKQAPRPALPEGERPPVEATLTCTLTADGGFSACAIDALSPSNTRFGRSALQAARRARVDMEQARGPLPLPQAGDRYTFRIWAQ